MIYDALLVATISLLLIALVSTFLFYGRIRRTNQEYEKAKDTVENIVISFDRQAQRHEQTLGNLAYKTETLSLRSDILKKEVTAQKGQLKGVIDKVQDFSVKIAGLDKGITDILDVQKRIDNKVEEIEKLKFVATKTEETTEIAFPIRRDKALAQLTETELNVLEILAKEGGKTSPEIKAKIRLAREHTARLMKKLYEEGYIERNTQKLPYKYIIKEEMRGLLKKAEVKT